MINRPIIGALTGVIIAALLLVIFAFASSQQLSLWSVFICIIPVSIAGFLGATLSENRRQASNIERNAKLKEPTGENQNLQENARDQKIDSEIGRGVRGGIIGVISFFVICFILFLIWYQVVIVAGGRPIPTPIGATPMPPRTVSGEAVDADAPSTVVVGENLRINARFTNLGKVTVESITVQISPDYFKGFALEGSVPPYVETHQYEGFKKENRQSFVFNVSIPPGETYEIAFNGKAILKGNYSVSIYICVGGDWDCAGFALRTIKIE